MKHHTRSFRALLLTGLATVSVAFLLRHTGVHALSDLTLGIIQGAGLGFCLTALIVARRHRKNSI